MSRTRISAAVAAALVLALLAPSLALLVPHCGMGSGDGCDNGAPGRCAGLWSSDCCDFVAPSPKERSSSSRLLSSVAPDATAAVLIASATSPGRLVASLDTSRSDGARVVRTALLESTVLLL